jgi:sister-chromatid-cohesion protein PDS5
VPNAPKLTEVLFKHCFDVLGGASKSNSGEELSKNVEHHMTSILTTLVEESAELPLEVVKTILAQFLRTSNKVTTSGAAKGKKGAQVEETQSTLQMKEAPPAYNMAENVCNAVPEKMGLHVSKYVNSILAEDLRLVPDTSASGKKSKKRVGEDEDEPEDQSPKIDLDAAENVHDLLRELWRACPSILQGVITQNLEMELSVEDKDLRLLAVETVADMISGIGHGGPPPHTALNPWAYPSQSLASASEKKVPYNWLTTPTSLVSFIAKYAKVYQEFVNRRNDKLTSVRSAWASGVGRVLMTSAGGVGLESDEEEKLLSYFAACLVDFDESVRLSAIVAIEQFDFDDIIQILGRSGGINEAGSLLSNLAQRVKDKKQKVRTEAIKLLANIWGVAAGAIAAGSDRVAELLGPIPTTILEAYYVNDREVHALVDRVLYESLLPLKFPEIKSKAQSNGNSQRVKDSQGVAGDAEPDPDKIRAERILILVKDLEPKAKSVLFSLQNKQTEHAKIMDAFLERCESYNGGVTDSEAEEKGTKLQLGKLIDYFSQQLPDRSKVVEDLWKFAKMHDRRSYQLIRFCMAADSDHSKIRKSIRELSKRIEDASGSTATLLETITLMVYRCSILLYNRSHVPAIIEFSRTDENGLGATAHEVLKEISKNKSEVFKAHVQDLCKSLESEAPSARKANGPGAVDDLKACAEFARKFPDDVPKDRKFLQAMLGFVSHGTPPKAAKYGVLIILSTANKKEMYAKDIFKQCTQGFEYGSGNYLARLAALSQLMLLGPDYLEASENDVVVDIAINQVLTNPDATPEPVEGDLDPIWTDELDDNCAAKFWALKILVNRLRGYGEDEPMLDEATKPVFQFLNNLVQKHGQISRTRASLKAHQSRLRLVAAQLLLKLCCEKRFNQRFSPTSFNALATVAMDPNAHVRAGFTDKIMKYLAQQKLSMRFYTPLFLLGHEPDLVIKERAITWLKSRAVAFARSKDTSMEASFARLISLLAHHPDWIADDDDDMEEKSEEEKTAVLCETLKAFLGFITFYLKCVATRDNLSLIYHVAQRVKAVQDGITSADRPTAAEGAENVRIMNERLYMLSDLSQEVIQAFEKLNGWNLQAWPGKVNMPGGIFVRMPDHQTAQRVAMKRYLPAEMLEDMDHLVRDAFRTKKVRRRIFLNLEVMPKLGILPCDAHQKSTLVV